MNSMRKLCGFKYTGDLVLGMHDALVEMTGILAGLAMAIDSARVMVLAGIIASVSASLSMAAANYMARRTDNHPDAFRCAVYTGLMYLGTSISVTIPFCVIPNRVWALGVMAVVAVAIIVVFNLWITCDGRRSFWGRLVEMLGVCLGVSVASFLIGQVAKVMLGVSI